MLHQCLSPLFCGWKWATPLRCCHCYSVSFHLSVTGPSTGSSDLICCSKLRHSAAAPIPSPIIWGNLVRFNCFPGWAFTVQILGSANSLWDYVKFQPKHSSEAIMKSFPTFSPRFTPGSFPGQKLVVYPMGAIKTGLPAVMHWWCSSAVGPPTLQLWPPRDSRNEGKPQPDHKALRKASISHHSLRERWVCHHCTSQQEVFLVSLASPSQGESICWGRKHNYWILRGADNVSNSLQKIIGLRNLINGSYWGRD